MIELIMLNNKIEELSWLYPMLDAIDLLEKARAEIRKENESTNE